MEALCNDQRGTYLSSVPGAFDFDFASQMGIWLYMGEVGAGDLNRLTQHDIF